jgi:hypothetical protein
MYKIEAKKRGFLQDLWHAKMMLDDEVEDIKRQMEENRKARVNWNKDLCDLLGKPEGTDIKINELVMAIMGMDGGEDDRAEKDTDQRPVGNVSEQE